MKIIDPSHYIKCQVQNITKYFVLNCVQGLVGNACNINIAKYKLSKQISFF